MKRSDALCKEVKERYEAEMRRKTELNNMASITVDYSGAAEPPVRRSESH